MVDYQLWGFSPKIKMELIPMTKEKLDQIYPQVDLSKMNYAEIIKFMKWKQMPGKNGFYYMIYSPDNYLFILKDRTKEDLEKFLIEKKMLIRTSEIDESTVEGKKKALKVFSEQDNKLFSYYNNGSEGIYYYNEGRSMGGSDYDDPSAILYLDEKLNKYIVKEHTSRGSNLIDQFDKLQDAVQTFLQCEAID